MARSSIPTSPRDQVLLHSISTTVTTVLPTRCAVMVPHFDLLVHNWHDRQDTFLIVGTYFIWWQTVLSITTEIIINISCIIIITAFITFSERQFRKTLIKNKNIFERRGAEVIVGEGGHYVCVFSVAVLSSIWMCIITILSLSQKTLAHSWTLFCIKRSTHCHSQVLRFCSLVTLLSRLIPTSKAPFSIKTESIRLSYITCQCHMVRLRHKPLG